jgi:hypothetical protein
MQNMLMPGGTAQLSPGAQDMAVAQHRPSAPPPAFAPMAKPTPQEVAQHRGELAVVLKGLVSLAHKPTGSLSKRDVFDAVGDMIAEGAFSTPQAKQQIIAQLAELPDNEAVIRQAIGTRIAAAADLRDRFHAQHGETE